MKARSSLEPCCETMFRQISSECLCYSKQHDNPWDCPNILVFLGAGNYGLMIGDSIFTKIEFCPWCGANLYTGD